MHEGRHDATTGTHGGMFGVGILPWHAKQAAWSGSGMMPAQESRPLQCDPPGKDIPQGGWLGASQDTG